MGSVASGLRNVASGLGNLFSGGGGGQSPGSAPTQSQNQPPADVSNLWTNPIATAEQAVGQGPNPQQPQLPQQPTFQQPPPPQPASTPSAAGGYGGGQETRPPTVPVGASAQPQTPPETPPGIAPTSTGLPQTPPAQAAIGAAPTTPPSTAPTTNVQQYGARRPLPPAPPAPAAATNPRSLPLSQHGYYPDVAGSAREAGAGPPAGGGSQQAVNSLQALMNLLSGGQNAVAPNLQGLTNQAGPAYGTSPIRPPATPGGSAAQAIQAGMQQARQQEGQQRPGEKPPLVLRDPSDPSKGYMVDPSANQGGQQQADGSRVPTNGMPGGTTPNAPPASQGYGATPDQGNRPKFYKSKLTINGQQFDFGSGGGQFPSLPYGTYHLHPGAVGSIGKRIGAVAGISDSNNPGNNTVNDPLYRGSGGNHARDGVEIHPDTNGRLVTNGCIGIARNQFGAFNQQFQQMAARGPLKLTVGPNGASIEPDTGARVAATGMQAQAGAPTMGTIPGSQSPAGTRPPDVNYNPQDYTRSLFQIEGGGNVNAPRTGSNRGIAQFGPAEERHYGITNRRDVSQEARAVQQEAQENTSHLQQAGVEATPANLYLLHQQGRAGGTALLQADPNTPAWQAVRKYYGSDAIAQRAIHGNIPSDNPLRNVPANQITAGQFRDMWQQRFNRQMPQQTSSQTQLPIQLAGDINPDIARMVEQRNKELESDRRRNAILAGRPTIEGGSRSRGSRPPSNRPFHASDIDEFIHRNAGSLINAIPANRILSILRGAVQPTTVGRDEDVR